MNIINTASDDIEYQNDGKYWTENETYILNKYYNLFIIFFL